LKKISDWVNITRKKYLAIPCISDLYNICTVDVKNFLHTQHESNYFPHMCWTQHRISKGKSVKVYVKLPHNDERPASWEWLYKCISTRLAGNC